GPSVLDARAGQRPGECPAPPRLVSRERPDRPLGRREDQLVITWAPAAQAPLAQVGGQRRQKPDRAVGRATLSSQTRQSTTALGVRSPRTASMVTQPSGLL